MSKFNDLVKNLENHGGLSINIEDGDKELDPVINIGDNGLHIQYCHYNNKPLVLCDWNEEAGELTTIKAYDHGEYKELLSKILEVL